MKLNVATHNAHKLREIGEILPGYDIAADDPDAEETAPDFAGNALIKVRAIAARHPGAWSMGTTADSRYAPSVAHRACGARVTQVSLPTPLRTTPCC